MPGPSQRRCGQNPRSRGQVEARGFGPAKKGGVIASSSAQVHSQQVIELKFVVPTSHFGQRAVLAAP